MNLGTQLLLCWELWKDFLKQTFGGGTYFPTAPGSNFNYVK